MQRLTYTTQVALNDKCTTRLFLMWHPSTFRDPGYLRLIQNKHTLNTCKSKKQDFAQKPVPCIHTFHQCTTPHQRSYLPRCRQMRAGRNLQAPFCGNRPNYRKYCQYIAVNLVPDTIWASCPAPKPQGSICGVPMDSTQVTYYHPKS